MEQLNVKRKSKNNWWIGLLMVIIVFLLWRFFMHDSEKSIRLSPITDSTTRMDDSTTRMDDSTTRMEDTTVRIVD